MVFLQKELNHISFWLANVIGWSQCWLVVMVTIKRCFGVVPVWMILSLSYLSSQIVLYNCYRCKLVSMVDKWKALIWALHNLIVLHAVGANWLAVLNWVWTDFTAILSSPNDNLQSSHSLEPFIIPSILAAGAPFHLCQPQYFSHRWMKW